MTSDKVIDLSFGLVTLVPVAFLNSADQFFSVPLGALKIVVRQLSPLRLDFTFELPPFPLQDVFIHESAPFVKRVKRRFKQEAYLDQRNGRLLDDVQVSLRQPL